MTAGEEVVVGESLQLGGLRMLEVSAPVVPADGIGAPHFCLILQVEGRSRHRQEDRESQLSPGDFALYVSTRPYEVSHSPPARFLRIAVPDELMRRHLTSPEDVVGVRVMGSRGMPAVLSGFIRNFWAARHEGRDPIVARRMSYTLLDLITAAYAVTPHARQERSTLVAAHRSRIMGYIEAHLRDPHLSPTTVAQACKITARYLHHLFTAESETVTQYIQRRRLEECARALVAAPMRARLVTEVAFDYGFNSLTHFGRVFRNQFGLTPSEYRRAAREPA
jgi:AraC-like DNA-binding protein